jgi:hypothetical protein
MGISHIFKTSDQLSAVLLLDENAMLQTEHKQKKVYFRRQIFACVGKVLHVFFCVLFGSYLNLGYNDVKNVLVIFYFLRKCD